MLRIKLSVPLKDDTNISLFLSLKVLLANLGTDSYFDKPWSEYREGFGDRNEDFCNGEYKDP